MSDSYLDWLDINWVKENSSIGDNQGLPFTDRFVCLINNSPKSDKKSGWLQLQVLSVEVPNFSLESTEIELNGARRFTINKRSDGELGITFLDTPDLSLRRFFFNWIQKSVNISEKGVVRQYMKDFISDAEIVIFPLDYKGTAKYADRFIKAFPYDISGISYNYGQSGELLKTTIKFKYMYHHITEIQSADPYTN